MIMGLILFYYLLVECNQQS